MKVKAKGRTWAAQTRKLGMSKVGSRYSYLEKRQVVEYELTEEQASELISLLAQALKQLEEQDEKIALLEERLLQFDRPSQQPNGRRVWQYKLNMAAYGD